MSAKTKTDNNTFNIILILLFLSFFEESVLPGFSTIALFSVLFIPVVIVFWFFLSGTHLNRTDKHIVLAFLLVAIVQLFGIRFNSLYSSITPIYRSLTSLAVVLYIRHSVLTERKCNSFLVLSIVEILIGFSSFIFPEASNGNIFYGNLNTVGALFFTFFALNVLIYLKSRRVVFSVMALFDVVNILISNTRTALFLVVISLLLFLILKKMRAKNIEPKIFFTVMIVLLIAFVAFYYNIKESSIYGMLNQISKKLFNKNFDSGRPDLWHYTTDSVGSKWLFGQGTGVDLENFIPTVKTSHSVYFDMYLQNGLVGVILFAISIFTCLNAKGKWVKNNINLFILVFAFVIILYNAVGIVLIKPRSGIGLLHWILIAIPYVYKKSDNKKSIKHDKSYSSGLQRQRVY